MNPEDYLHELQRRELKTARDQLRGFLEKHEYILAEFPALKQEYVENLATLPGKELWQVVDEAHTHLKAALSLRERVAEAIQALPGWEAAKDYGKQICAAATTDTLVSLSKKWAEEYQRQQRIADERQKRKEELASQEQKESKAIRKARELGFVLGRDTFLDTRTHLTWMRNLATMNGNETGFSWRAVKWYLDNENKNRLFGFNDWRVPTFDELKTLVSRGLVGCLKTSEPREHCSRFVLAEVITSYAARNYCVWYRCPWDSKQAGTIRFKNGTLGMDKPDAYTSPNGDYAYCIYDSYVGDYNNRNPYLRLVR